MEKTPDYAVIIPTLNAEKYIDALLDALTKQVPPPREILVVDSASDDDTVSRARRHPGVRVIPILRADFDHGGTRDMAIRTCSQPFVVLMTQDALPVDDRCMAALLEPFGDPGVAAVCARQIARPEASERERLVRTFRYPAESFTWSKAELGDMGIRGYLLSDVCAAYRREAYYAVGGFVHPLMTDEDMLIAADFLDAGYRLAYRSEARVLHSHSYTPRQEFARNRLIGAFMAQYGHRFQTGELGEGVRLVKTVSVQLVKRGRFFELFGFGLNCAARILGNRAGRRLGKTHA